MGNFIDGINFPEGGLLRGGLLGWLGEASVWSAELGTLGGTPPKACYKRASSRFLRPPRWHFNIVVGNDSFMEGGKFHDRHQHVFSRHLGRGQLLRWHLALRAACFAMDNLAGLRGCLVGRAWDVGWYSATPLKACNWRAFQGF